LIKNVTLSLFVLLALQGCTKQSVELKPNTQDALIKQLYTKIYILEKKLDDNKNRQIIDELKKDIEYHEQILTTLAKDVNEFLVKKEPQDNGEEIEKNSEIEEFKPKTFRLIRESELFDSDGASVDIWGKGTSFTSYMKKGNLYKITGYFTEQAWKKSDRDLWVLSGDVRERR